VVSICHRNFLQLATDPLKRHPHLSRMMMTRSY
jgi:hypothetical protein